MKKLSSAILAVYFAVMCVPAAKAHSIEDNKVLFAPILQMMTAEISELKLLMSLQKKEF